MKGTFPIDKFQEIQTPFYYYDTNVLRQTLKTINEEAGKHEGFEVHYAVKANANPKVLNIICQAGLGADCVSGGEIQAAIKAGFPASKIVYAGVGKVFRSWKSSMNWLKNRIRLRRFVSASIRMSAPIRMQTSQQVWQKTSSELPCATWKP